MIEYVLVSKMLQGFTVQRMALELRGLALDTTLSGMDENNREVR